MKKLSCWINKIATTQLTVVFLAVILLFVTLILPKENERAIREYGDVSPDTSFIYHGDDLLNMAETYGETGRLLYVQARMRFDIVFPLVYGGFLCLSISWLLQRLLSENSGWCVLNILPLGGVGFDLLENLFASVIMITYPEQIFWMLKVTPIITILKWLFVGGSFIVVFDLLVLYLIKKVKNK
ncbi:MAG: hypothetical protein JEZ00_01155 [Anaerolineaceae bacterium]|nr:hypothetical protein [Anaerolineaceae bacterium]